MAEKLIVGSLADKQKGDGVPSNRVRVGLCFASALKFNWGNLD